MARLTPKLWSDLRYVWEHEPREGYSWLAKESGVNVSATAIRKAAKREGWRKVPEAAKRAPEEPDAPKTTPRRSRAQAAPSPDRTARTMAIRSIATAPELTDRERLFAVEYVKDFDAKRAARAAGYSQKTQPWQILKRERVQTAINEAVETRLMAKGLTGEDVLRIWTEIVLFDVNELVEFRRIPCECCYQQTDTPGMTLKRYSERKKEHDRIRAALLRQNPENDIGEFPSARTFAFIDPNGYPDPDCPVCHGLGEPFVVMKDTRNLSPVARLMYEGVKQSKDGFEMLMFSKERALENLAKALGVFRDKEEEKAAAFPDEEKLDELYNSIMAASRERDRQLRINRGIEDAEDWGCTPEEA